MGKHLRVLTPTEIKERSREEAARSIVDVAAELEKLTPKQKRLAIEVLTNPGAGAVEQAKNAGYKVAPGSKPNHLKKAIEGKLSATLREFGISEDDLAKVVTDGLQATTVKIIKKKIYDDGECKGEEVEYHEVPDHPTRLATFKVVAALGNYFPAKRVQVEGEIGHNVFSKIDPRVLEERVRELQKKELAVDADYEVEDE